MLRKKICYTMLIVVLICISAVSLVKVYQYYQKVKSYEQNISQQQNVISEQINELSELKDEIVALEEQGDLLQSLEELHIGWMNAEFLQELSQKKYMTNENVCVRKAPSDHSAFQSYNVLSYDLVDVIYAVNTTHMLSPTREEVENGIWVLVHFLSSEPEDTVGWVKWNELIEYTNDTMHMLRSPVKVSEDAIDLETGKPISSIFYDGSIRRYEGDYAVISSEVGGRSCKVDKKYLIYPDPGISQIPKEVISELHMVDAFDSNFELDIENKHIMAAENVAVRAIPDDMAAANKTLTYQMVTVRAAVYGPGDEKWALVSFVELDTISDNIGWVKVSELMEYGEDNYHLLTYPVELKEGTTDLQTGKEAHMDHFKITQIGDDRVSVVSAGGRGYEVAPQAVIYPAFEKE